MYAAKVKFRLNKQHTLQMTEENNTLQKLSDLILVITIIY